MLPELTRRAPVAGPAADDAAGSIREGHRIARAIVARAQAQATELEAAAREEGLEIGARLATERDGAALRNAAAALTAATARYDAMTHELGEQLQESLPQMAVTIAERILRRELSMRPETLALVIRDAIATLTPATRVELRLHPDDLATLERYRPLVAEALGGAELKLEAAVEVGVGGCFIETEALTLGAGPLQQLERALALLGGEGA
jgi:flagellar assembly protein FliH